VITLGDVLFATGSADLKSGSRQTLDKLTAFLQAYPKRGVQIDGYTDNVGSADYNQGLSERRADSVRDALTRMCIARDSILTKGLGEGSPVADNGLPVADSRTAVRVIVLTGVDRTASAQVR
jgi:outer membrane protein OmpA-like peptidoglycan-associated protein